MNTSGGSSAYETPLKCEYDRADADSRKGSNEGIFAACHTQVKNADNAPSLDRK